MGRNIKQSVLLSCWVVSLLLIGWLLGILTKTQLAGWYTTLQRSSITPANAVFPIVWTILYIFIAISGWEIWRTPNFASLTKIKYYYLIQLVLNWSWTPLFFTFHLIGLSLLSLLIMDVIVGYIIFLAYRHLKRVSVLLFPYFLWILLATYLNFYIVVHA